MYKERLNPKSKVFFQCPKVRPKNDVWYDVSPLGHNLLGKMMSDIYEKAGIAKQCTNHSLRATAVHILDEAEFAGRHMYRYIMSIIGHKSESSLKTYTSCTSERALRDMSNTINSNLRPTSSGSTTENKENVVVDQNVESLFNPNEINSELTDFDDNNIADFLMLSDSQMESLVTMVNDVDNTSGRHGDVSNNVALP